MGPRGRSCFRRRCDGETGTGLVRPIGAKLMATPRLATGYCARFISGTAKASCYLRRRFPFRTPQFVGEQVAVRHPRQAVQREVERAADRGKREVRDRRIDEVEERD